MKLLIVRHGATEWNKNSRIQGCLDIPLSKEGIVQAQLTANRLINFTVNYIFASDLMRARSTAKIISDTLKIPFVTDKRLREMHFGEWQGLSLEQIDNLYHEKLLLWQDKPAEVSFNGGENLYDVKRRALEFIQEIYLKNKDDNIIIVTHGTFIKVLILSLLNIDLNVYKNLKQDNGALNIIDINDGKATLLLYNDTCYL
ncbi:histidine phosphatase family protein [Calorimonas adulescens]|jgi:Phosphoglycerate mutase family.|uniref:Histidine phosphatase family protein n=1 Tax=Calorimonas adulescens TaxID=2606906 RepID=A0A5D8Q842_9THEO|nr:histidine phosphatase family protein [Calorimonas adulescens]TZE80810.1 histidine phosphatase family protein [Calorimonas adulescens]